MNFSKLVNEYKNKCNDFNVPEQTVMYYLLEICQREDINLYMNFNEEIPSGILEEFEKGMLRIFNHEPVQHVIGYSWFYGYKFIVNPNVLIPRYETEELVSYVLQSIDNIFESYDKLSLCDIGTGSGAIAISLKCEENKLDVYASDISVEAIEVAKENAKVNNADVKFFTGDMLQPLIENNIKVDVLVCNPPYIPNDEVLEDFVVEHEPHVALFGGIDGLKYYRNVFENCKKILKEKSFMAFEIGYNQKDVLSREVEKYFPGVEYEVIKDINGKDRMLFVYFK